MCPVVIVWSSQRVHNTSCAVRAPVAASLCTYDAMITVTVATAAMKPTVVSIQFIDQRHKQEKMQGPKKISPSFLSYIHIHIFIFI